MEPQRRALTLFFSVPFFPLRLWLCNGNLFNGAFDVRAKPPKLMSTSMGFLSMMMNVGQVLGPIISGVILASVLQYNGLFMSLKVLLAVSAVVFFVSGIAKIRG